MVVDCLRLDQWEAIRPLISTRFDIETAYYFSILPTATPFARNAIFSGLFPSELAARHPGVAARDSDDASLNAHEHELLVEQLKERAAVARCRCATRRSSPPPTARPCSPGCRRTWPRDGVTALVFNFIDQLTHGRTENSTLFEVARDTSALRSLTRTWFERSPLWARAA